MDILLTPEDSAGAKARDGDGPLGLRARTQNGCVVCGQDNPYGLRIQYVGSSEGADAVALDGDLTQRSFTATFTRQGQPVAALLVNRPRELPAIRTQIQRGTP